MAFGNPDFDVFQLPEEHEALRDQVRRFVETELYPHEKLVEDTDNVPAELAEGDPLHRNGRRQESRGEARRLGSSL